ncbi:MAG: response regulator transcription factor, partial [Chloroflexota bacterium]
NFLEVQGEFEVKGEASNGEEAIQLTEKLKPDVVLMDLNMPQVDGIEAIRKIKESSPDIKIIVLTAFTQNEKVFSAINAGVDGYLLKDIMPDELIAAIHSVLNGKPALHPDIVRKIMLGVATQNNQNRRVEQLTARENEVLNLLAEGKSNEDIAKALVISVLTVKTHVHNILNKLNMTKRVQAALFAANQPDMLGENKNSKDMKYKHQTS